MTNTNNVIALDNSNPRAAFKRREGGDLMDAHREWASRPADEAVWTVDDLVTRTEAQRKRSASKAGVAWDSLSVEADGEALALVGKGGTPVNLTNWSAGQLASAAGAPMGYLSKLPADLAAQCLSHGLSAHVERERDAQLLVGKGDAGLTLRAITTDAYERVWDVEIARRVARLCEDSTWGAAEAFRTAKGQAEHAWGQSSQLPLGWVGDRSMFLALLDYEGSVSHQGAELARFCLLSNSEVGAGSLRVTIGLVDFVCCNFIMWGCQEVHEASFRHVGSVREKWEAIAAPLAHQLTSGDRDTITERIDAARAFTLGDTEAKAQAVARAATGLPKGLIEDGFKRAADTPRYGDPRSAWGMLNGITEASQHATEHADKRADIDAKAARLLGLLDR